MSLITRAFVSAASFAAIVILSLVVEPEDSEAIPAFARQTGEACEKCHFMTFPALNRVGREFKRSAFTVVDGESLVKYDSSLSLPVVLNASLVLNSKITKTVTNGTGVTPSTRVTSYNIPFEVPLLLAGRVGGNVGFYVAMGRTETGGSANGQFVRTWKLLTSFKKDDVRYGVNVFNTAYGWTAGLENSNVFGQHGGVLNGSDVTALVMAGMMKMNIMGVTAWAGNELWSVGISGVVPDGFNRNFGAGARVIPGVRAVFSPKVAHWETRVGGGLLNGSSASSTGPGGARQVVGANMWFFDAEVQGEVEDTEIGIYADYAHTRAQANVTYNLFGAEPLETAPGGGFIGGVAAPGDSTNGWSIRAMVKPFESVIFGGGYGQTRFRSDVGVIGTSGAWNVGAIYELYENAEIKLLYGGQKVGPNYPTNLTGVGQNIRSTTLQFEALM